MQILVYRVQKFSIYRITGSDLTGSDTHATINPITVGGGSSGPECQKTAYREKFIKTKILDFWLTFNV